MPFWVILTIVGGMRGFLVAFLGGYNLGSFCSNFTRSDNCRGNRWGFMAHFVQFLSQNITQFPNGGREGYFSLHFDDFTIMGAINIDYHPKTPVFASFWTTFCTQIANRGEGGLIMRDFSRIVQFV